MIKSLFHIPAFVYSLENWKEIKSQLIDAIKEYPLAELNEDNARLHTDYFLNDTRGPYGLEVMKILQPTLDNFRNDLSKVMFQRVLDREEIHLVDIWHQKYEQYESHRPHAHGATHFACILYLNFIQGEHPVTRLYAPFSNFLNNDPLSWEYSDTTEGDIIIFPANTLHESPINYNTKPKEIISFNLILRPFLPSVGSPI
jgi:hypothetical protein